MGENLCQLYLWHGICNENKQGAQKLTSQRINNPLNKWANELKRQFSEEIQTAHKHIKKCSTSLATKGMQIKTTLRFHLTPVRMAIINNTNNKWGEDVRGKEHSLLVGT
jgi:hypothetical protein